MPEKLSKELSELKEEELVQFIRDTVARLHVVADYLETYVTDEVAQPEVGFDTSIDLNNGDSHGTASSP